MCLDAVHSCCESVIGARVLLVPRFAWHGNPISGRQGAVSHEIRVLLPDAFS